MMGPKEKRFMNAFESLFIGAKVEGTSGFVNLMAKKRAYFCDLRGSLLDDIDKHIDHVDSAPFREELFDKLYTFFHRYFCESGSLYFRHLPAHERIYERVYQNGKDITLAWKTRELYYVKSDILYTSMSIELGDGRLFYIDASAIQHKQNNTKRAEFVCVFEACEDIQDEQGRQQQRIRLKALTKTRKDTHIKDIVKEAKQAGAYGVTEEHVEQAIALFRRQAEVDYFIHKDARAFLREQYDLWMYRYIFQGVTRFDEQRLRQLQALKESAYAIIDFIAQFEDEVRHIWEKPKFVRDVHYVVTLDKLPDSMLDTLARHDGMAAQRDEWRALTLIDDDWQSEDLASRVRPHLPIDTKHFKDKELDILDALGDLDKALNGELVHSENWQALNSLRRRYANKVQCIYIDPPFNLDTSTQFLYRSNYKDANWATILDNRLALAKAWLSDKGSIFVRCDYNGNWIVRCIMDNIFTAENFNNEIIVSKSAKLTEKIKKYHHDYDSLMFYRNSKEYAFKAAEKKRGDVAWRAMHLPGVRWSPINDYAQLFSKDNIAEKGGKLVTRARIILGEERLPPEGRHWALSQESIFDYEKKGWIRLDKKSGNPLAKESEFQKYTDNWTDKLGYSSHWGFPTENSEIVIERSIETSSLKKKELILDFFLGSGTTTAVAHKLGRRWLGVEMGAHFYDVILPRMKKVLCYDTSGISKDIKDYQGGGAFKYYRLEQYEDALQKIAYCYRDSKQLSLDETLPPFQQYVFCADDKFTRSIEAQGDTITINLHDLYPDIDIGESLANILGKTIRRRTKEHVTFTDGSTRPINPASMTEAEKRDFITAIKPYLWWGQDF
ncbi:MAG: site-specific DNA-methyltransferase [Alphaproteobacteria bacterium GM7ARS4]|nr:site-specific DNA-methyltransferase [Alphaproteobacteria bacterium GM7ARS4]